MEEDIIEDCRGVPCVLVIERDQGIGESIGRYLKNVGFFVESEKSLRSASRFLANHFVNFMVIDGNMQDGSTVEYLEQLHKNGQFIPTLIVLDSASQAERLRALEFADDVLVRPFYVREMEARIRAILRRAPACRDWNLTENITLHDKPFPFCYAQVFPSSMTVKFSSGCIKAVGKREIGLMYLFYCEQNVILSRRDIIHHVWGLHANLESRSLDQYVVRIRRMFRENGCNISKFLRTIHSIGYLYTAPTTFSTDREFYLKKGQTMGRGENRAFHHDAS
ncbi:MAG: response regulator transcription factor [Puniceicoccales bacterium]|nr:response regulator transcription factor [Puniceicoccales bacterium]